MSPMLSAAYYTRHNTEIFFLVLFAMLALAALINHRVRSRRHHELPYGIRPITLYRDSLITFNDVPMPKLTESVEAAIAEGIMYVPYRKLRMIDAWKLIEPDFQTESV